MIRTSDVIFFLDVNPITWQSRSRGWWLYLHVKLSASQHYGGV
jgi:hypothetical protein